MSKGNAWIIPAFPFYINQYFYLLMNTDELLKFSIIDIAGLFVNIATLIIAYLLYRNFDVKKTHVNKQLETVLSLVEEINKTVIKVNFWTKIPSHVVERMQQPIDHTATLESWRLSLFLISQYDIKTQKFEDVFLHKTVLEVLPFVSYMNDPLLPKSIADKLRAFYSPITNYKQFEKASTDYVTLGSYGNQPSVLQYPDFIASFKSWENFVVSAKDLTHEIQRWLKRYGASDINLNVTFQHH